MWPLYVCAWITLGRVSILEGLEGRKGSGIGVIVLISKIKERIKIVGTNMVNFSLTNPLDMGCAYELLVREIPEVLELYSLCHCSYLPTITI